MTDAQLWHAAEELQGDIDLVAYKSLVRSLSHGEGIQGSREGAKNAKLRRQVPRILASSREYSDIPGFCKSASAAEIAAHGYVLTPGRYAGAEEVEDDGEPIEEKMPRLVAELHAQFAESATLEQAITANLRGLGYGG